MKIARFEVNGRSRYGVVEGDSIQVIQDEPWNAVSSEREEYALREVKLLAPVQPPDVFAIGLNYRQHAKESRMEIPPAPVIFLKATSSVIGPEVPIRLPAMAPGEVDYEAELVIVIGKSCRRVSEAEALRHVLGYTCGNDVSARDCQFKQDRQWARGKSFDTFCPLGPWIETELDPDHAAIELKLNGQVMQSSSTDDLIFGCAKLVSYCSQIATLRPGTVIMTGTPAGVGFPRKPPVFLKPGDAVEITVAGIGTLRNPVAAE
jgi:2-keto-4-pentenoate hydratase/2-oxohepta-3-ene-1,7-dioic acid hydratase in catechol pathway